MAIFRSKSKKEDGVDIKITSEDQKKLKYRSQNMHDPILSAVNEAQPFEESANIHARQSSMASDGQLKDIFGNVILNPDISNPSRARDERPLDTIRSFEYAITGDLTYKQQLETPTLGWRVRNDFPLFTENPYSAGAQGGAQNGAQQYDEYGQPIYNNNNANANYNNTPAVEQPVYVAGPSKDMEPKKKKRGLFGRKKN
ncbi:unnamed protein product [Ambrosiozyma monospora]|uniref:Unnamed protein product n=1 Tax=Ambrosiozyma monospora TaxID=43982 RepID=A0ACB5TR15_AMBMO|nr:unnamed protein product [Ambrosiozyma monospora]